MSFPLASSLPPFRDYTALQEPVAADDVAEFRRRSIAENRYIEPFPVARIVIISVVAVFFGGAFLGIVGAIAAVIIQSAELPPGLLVVAAAILLLVLAGGVTAIVVGSVRARRRRWLRIYRQEGFARANGLLFSPRDANPRYPGSLFDIGSSRVALDHFRTLTGRALDFGNYSYTTGSGEDATTHHWGFLAMGLDRELPHMLLDATANNGVFGGSNLPARFDRDQVLSLEGDFDRYFTLYCPRQYERDALYVFTPDLMALLIDSAATFDVEIVDRWLFVYSGTRFDMTDAATIDRLLRIVDTVGAKTVSQTSRYSDDRAAPRASIGAVADGAAGGASPSVAPGGRRLRRRGPVIGVVVVVVFVTIQIVSFVGQLR